MSILLRCNRSFADVERAALFTCLVLECQRTAEDKRGRLAAFCSNENDDCVEPTSCQPTKTMTTNQYPAFQSPFHSASTYRRFERLNSDDLIPRCERTFTMPSVYTMKRRQSPISTSRRLSVCFSDRNPYLADSERS